MIPVNTQEAAEKMPDLLTAVAHGELVVFFQNGQAVAELHAPRKEYDPTLLPPALPEQIMGPKTRFGGWLERHPPVALKTPLTAGETQELYDSM